MCGITGFWRPQGLNEAAARTTLIEMMDTIRHRGPDDAGTWIDPAAGIALGFRRLAIIDLTPTGRQPMTSASGRFVIVFNGEIYNFQDLRRELAAQGTAFRGRSDTEVLLEALEAWGLRRTLERCNGMFAFALWDKAERTLHLARDRAGEKPLYFGWSGSTLLFGSELKALRAHPDFQAQIDQNALALYLRRGYVPGPYCIYRGIQKLRPGTWLTVRPDRFGAGAVPTAYWSPREVAEAAAADPFRGSAEDAVEALHELLTDAVKLRMEADVPLGAFLSGGLDSSTIVALMQANSSRPVRTFTIGFREERHDEARYAAAIAKHLGTEHTEQYLTPVEARAVIPRLPVLYDEPFADTSQIPTFLVSELTRRHVTVSLSGDAGDELFGGYRRHRLGPAIWRGISWMPLSMRRGLAGLLAPPRTANGGVLGPALSRITHALTGKRNLVERLRQAAEILPVESPIALYHYMMSYWKHPNVLLPEAREPLVPATDPSRWPNLGASPAQIMMYLDTVAWLPDDILVKLDRATMGTSLEARIPLLDHRVIEFAWRLPLRIRLHRNGTKWPLRQVLDRYVPRHLVDRPKRGFHMPVAEWLRGPLRDWAEALLDERHLHDSGLDPRPVREKWAEHLAGTTRWDYHLWTVLMYSAWVDSTTQTLHPAAA